MAARTGFEPETFRTKGIESTNAPQRPRCIFCKNSVFELSLESYLRAYMRLYLFGASIEGQNNYFQQGEYTVDMQGDGAAVMVPNSHSES